MLRVGKETGRLGTAIRGGGKRLAVALVAGSLLVVGLGTTGTATVSPDADPVVIRDWNATMVATIVVDAGKANAEAFMWFGFVQAAVYNAVEGITRDYELYKWRKDGLRSASPEAAAAQAAHDVLLHYFPASQVRLDTQLATSLAGVTDGAAEQQGTAYGAASAAHFIKQRANDGRNAPITFDQAPAKGVWRPTPPTDDAVPRPVAQSGQAADDDVVHAVPSGTTAGVEICADTRRTSTKSKHSGQRRARRGRRRRRRRRCSRPMSRSGRTRLLFAI